MSPALFAQYNQDIHLTNGNTTAYKVSEIDSISFSSDGVPIMQLKLNDGSSVNYQLSLINQVTFSGMPSSEYPLGTVHCIVGGSKIVDVLNPTTGRIWMDRNLGASQAAQSPDDEDAYGDFYQWGRFSDGHQCRNSSDTSALSSINAPAHGKFIISPASPFDWLSAQNDNLWQGVNGVNNPCPAGYRIPTSAEWNAERLSWGSNNKSGAFQSALKLTAAGLRSSQEGEITNTGSQGIYWSSTVSESSSGVLGFGNSNAYMT